MFCLLGATDAGIPVYMYEFVHQAEIYQHTRPHFVKADHADDVVFMFGACFWNGHIKIGGWCHILIYTKMNPHTSGFSGNK